MTYDPYIGYKYYYKYFIDWIMSHDTKKNPMTKIWDMTHRLGTTGVKDTDTFIINKIRKINKTIYGIRLENKEWFQKKVTDCFLKS